MRSKTVFLRRCQGTVSKDAVCTGDSTQDTPNLMGLTPFDEPFDQAQDKLRTGFEEPAQWRAPQGFGPAQPRVLRQPA